MGLWNAVLCGWIVGRSLQRAERSLTGHAALQLPLHFLRGALLQRISTAGNSQACDHEQDPHAFHLLILGSVNNVARTLKRCASDQRFNVLTFNAPMIP